MKLHWNVYRHNGFTWLMVNGKTYKTANLNEALDQVEKMANEMGPVVPEPEE
jgi:hypothetical protein